MKKMKKLLSVVLAVIMALSCMSVMASAAKTSYQSVDNLETLGAYSPYGTVTRLSTEERASILLDFLDNVLPGLNINMGTVLDVLGLTITIDFTSVDAMLGSLDSFANTFDNWLFSAAALIVNLGVLESLSFDTWATGMTRSGTAQLTILYEILQLLSANESVVATVLSDGLDLGIVGGLISGLDLTSINEIITDIPSMIKGMVFPMFERKDDTQAWCQTLYSNSKGDGKIISTLQTFVTGLFSKPMSTTTLKVGTNGAEITSKHQGFYNLFAEGYRYMYTYTADVGDVLEGTESEKADTITSYIYTYDEETESWSYVEEKTFTQTMEYIGGVATGDYVYTAEDGTNVKYYEDDSYWLPELVADGVTVDPTTESIATLLYKMIPYVFDAMAPVVVNGSLKKLLSGLFGMSWTKVVDDITDTETLATVQALPGYDASLEVFGEQGTYLWEWSAFDIVTVDGVDYYYYRYQDQLFQGDDSNCNEYMQIINWDYTITGELLNKYIPTGTTGTEKSEAGYTRILHGVNDFLVELATEVLDLSVLNIELAAGDNSNLVGNIKTVAQAIIKHQPKSIFGETTDAEGNVSYGDFYNLIVSDDNDTVLVGIAALVIDLLAPQVIIEPEAIYDSTTGKATVKVGALLAAMLRELATQLLPSVNYDALIYADYNAGTFVSGKDNDYWLDVLLTIATDIGYKYLTNLIDMNEDLLGSAFATGGVIDWQESRTYSESDLKLTSDVNLWEQRVDFIIDWALQNDFADGTALTWNMENFVGKYLDAAGITYSYATAEDPWAKLDCILDNILFLDQFTSEDDLEEGLRGTIIDLVNLNWANILGTESTTGLFDIPTDSKVRTTDAVSAISLEVKDLINGLLMDVGQSNDSGAGTYYFIPEAVTTIDELATQSNISTLARTLVGNLDDAYDNGLLVTVLPIANFFLGWTTDPQKYADPTVIWTNEEYQSYLYSADGSTVTTTMSITNNSSGMLLKHRADTGVSGNFLSAEDSPYTMRVTGIASDDISGTITATNLNVDVAPYGTLDVVISFPYEAEKEVVLEVSYEFDGKDGEPVGGTQTMYVTQFTSSSYADSSVVTASASDSAGTEALWGAIATKNEITRHAYSPYLFTDSLVTIDGWGIKFEKTDSSKNAWISAGSIATTSAPISTKPTSEWVHGSSENSELRPEGVLKHTDSDETDTSTTWTLYPYSYDSDSTTEVTSGTALTLGDVSITWTNSSSNSVSFSITDQELYYYDIYELQTLWNDAVEVHKADIDTSVEAIATAWNNFKSARNAATQLVMGPKMRSTFTTLYAESNVASILENLQTTWDALNEAIAEAETNASATGVSDTALLEEALAADTSVTGFEINFQDFDLFEYFEYQDYRTNARNIMKTMTAPEVLAGGYIEGSGISYSELTSVIANETNSNISTGIKNTITYYTEEEIAASEEAYNNFVAPYYTKLYLDDQASRLDWYRGFILSVSADKSFLAKEISYAGANYPASDESLYTADTWARYTAALENANAVVAGTYTEEIDGASVNVSAYPSKVFAVKYELMVAMKNLLLKTESAIENGATNNLIALKAEAEAIFALSYDEIELSEEAIAAGMTKDEALGHLIRAVGYYYTGEDENTWNLYADSALEYIDNDRPNKSTNLAKIAATESNLSAAIAYFDMGEEAAPELGAIDGTTGAFGEVTTDEETGLVTGYIYGVAAGTTVETNFALVDETTGYTKKVASTLPGASTDGTGAKVQVYNNNDELVAEYTLIVFGDVNGDAAITASDYSEVLGYVLGSSATDVQAIAADCADAESINNPTITASDYSEVLGYVLGETATVNPYAA